jgi:hypothetical protein
MEAVMCIDAVLFVVGSAVLFYMVLKVITPDKDDRDDQWENDDDDEEER